MSELEQMPWFVKMCLLTECMLPLMVSCSRDEVSQRLATLAV